MAVMMRTRDRRCMTCSRVYASWFRLQHHRAADHAPRTSHDIRRTSLCIVKTGDLAKVRRLRKRGQP